MPSRREWLMLLGGVGTGAVGYNYILDGNTPKFPDVDDIPEMPKLSKKGRRRFNLNAGGYEYAKWTDGGTIDIVFVDDPPMQEWYLVGPEPQRELLAKGAPPTFGGAQNVALEHPITEGEYLLTGAKIRQDPDSFLGVSADRTGTARFDVTVDVRVESVNLDDQDSIIIEIRNTGSCPAVIHGVALDRSDGLIELLHGKELTIPEQSVEVSTIPPSRSPSLETIGIDVHQHRFWFESDGDSFNRIDKPSRSATT